MKETTDPRHAGPRCECCDRPTATAAAWEELPEEAGANLCWGPHHCPPVDWRARALVAEKELAAARARAEQAERRRDRWRAIAETRPEVWRRRAESWESTARNRAERLANLDSRIAKLCSLLGAHFPDQPHDIGFLESRVGLLAKRGLAALDAGGDHG
jgi:hypothetical protein